jgi:hypothetical protein
MKSYPKPVDRQNGCKVGWLTYKLKRDAIKASKIAIENGYIMESMGYDFGYQVPGAITGNSKSGWIVTIP